MSIPITISLLYKGRQKDYQAVFTDNNEALLFKVNIDDKVFCFEGSLNNSFHVKDGSDKQQSSVDKTMLDAVSQQLNQIFF